MLDNKKRLGDLPAYSKGWFQVGWSTDVPCGKVKTVHFFDQDIVLFRTGEGVLSAVDPHCPHLGTHLGHGSRVVGNSLVCPFHGWEFSADGQCEKIPYCKRIPKNANVRKWHTEEKFGLIYVYYSLDQSQPTYSVPVLTDVFKHRWCSFSKVIHKLDTRSQEVMENFVDSPHFYFLHSQEMPLLELKQEGSELHIVQKLKHKAWVTTQSTTLNIKMLEPGVHSIYFSDMPLNLRMILISSLTPIDEDHVANFVSLGLERKIPLISVLLQKILFFQAMRVYRQDKDIWKYKKYLKKPLLCEGDGPIFKMRRWYQQFCVTQEKPQINIGETSMAVVQISKGIS